MTVHTEKPKHIAGVVPVQLGGIPPFSDAARGDYVTFLEQRYKEVQSVAEASLRNPEFQYSLMPMTSELLLHGDEDHYLLAYSFLLTKELLHKLRAARTRKGSELTQDELVAVGLAEGAEAVTPEFSAGAMNVINASLYASEIGREAAAGVARMYAQSRPLNYAIGRLLASHLGSAKTVRIKELASSSSVRHWEDIAHGMSANAAVHITLTLTDFMKTMPVSTMKLPNLDAYYEQYSLFDELPTVAAAERFNVIITTYGFDSVWQPEDERLTRVGEQWYRTLYRVKVADWAPRRDELLLALRVGKPLEGAFLRDYDGIAVETAIQPIDISAHPFARYITNNGKDIIDVPGGLIKRVVNAFDTQLRDDGVFISGDVAHFKLSSHEVGQGDLTDTDRRLSGVAARFKIEDYALAKQVLESEYDFNVALIPLSDLAALYLTGKDKPYSRHAVADVVAILKELPDNGLMVVTRKAA